MAKKSKTCAVAFELEPKLTSYEDFHPFAQLNTEDKDNYILTIHLPGFKQQQVIVTRTRPSHKIRIEGERIGANNKRQKFIQFFKIPQNSKIAMIQAKWEKDRLIIIMPKEMNKNAEAKEEQVAVEMNREEGQCRVYLGVGALGGVVALACAALGAYLSYIINAKA